MYHWRGPAMGEEKGRRLARADLWLPVPPGGGGQGGAVPAGSGAFRARAPEGFGRRRAASGVRRPRLRRGVRGGVLLGWEEHQRSRGGSVVAKTVVEARLRGDEEAFAWATASLGEARRSKKRRASALLEAVVEELAFDLGARHFPP